MNIILEEREGRTKKKGNKKTPQVQGFGIKEMDDSIPSKMFILFLNNSSH